MSSPEEPRRVLPAQPSLEFLRKEAKRRAKADGVKLAEAQHVLAKDYGYRNWADMMHLVQFMGASPLSQAAMRGQVDAVRSLLSEGAAVDGAEDEVDSPLFRVCDGAADAEARIEIARTLIEAGAFVRAMCTKGATPLHAAARRGPPDLVRLLLQNGALFWQGDAKDVRPYDYAEKGKPIGRDEVMSLLADGPRLIDPQFREAVAAIQKGDIAALSALLDAHPRLLKERAIEPDIHARGYFTDPALFWFIANNPTLIPKSPDNIVEIAQAMIARGVKQDDLSYALELVMTNGMMPEAQQLALVKVLVEAGAQPGGMIGSLGHRQTAPAAWLVDNGKVALTPIIAAGLGRVEALRGLLRSASKEEATRALGLAVINKQTEAARLCLDAGADPNAFMACHTHSTPLHQAALGGDLSTLRLLLERGARTDTLDTLWHGTPLGWATHGKQPEAAEILREAMGLKEANEPG
jgi:ankyrin repeat protein